MLEQTPKKLNKDQLKVVALKQRIGEIVSEYEESIAGMRADFTQQLESMQEYVESQQKRIQELEDASKEKEETSSTD